MLELWRKIPAAEQRAVLGLALLVGAGVTFTATGNGHAAVMIDYFLIARTIQSYVVDAIQRGLAAPEQQPPA